MGGDDFESGAGVRIEPNRHAGSVSARGGAARGASGAEFRPVLPEAGARAAAPVAPAAATASLDALLALQGVGDPLRERRRAAVRRGRDLLDALEAARIDLLAGDLSPARLERLAALVGSARDAVDPALDALIEDIELRVLVELAKHGRFLA